MIKFDRLGGTLKKAGGRKRCQNFRQGTYNVTGQDRPGKVPLRTFLPPAEEMTPMKVFRIPQDFSSISAACASSLVEPGTIILVTKNVYCETVVIPPDKPGLHLLADGGGVILDGGETLAAAFLINADNTEISGFTIVNYVVAGIRASRSTAARLVGNTVTRVTGGNGIELLETFFTLVWQNNVTGARYDGLALMGRDNWVISNELTGNGGNGIQTLTATTVGNTILANRIRANGASGFADAAGLNLVRGNLLAENSAAGIHEHGGTGCAAIIDNKVSGNQADGINLATGRNTVRGNEVKDNVLAGIRVDGDHNTVRDNLIAGNRAGGISIAAPALQNLVTGNSLAGNTPFDIHPLGSDNYLAGNASPPRLPAGNDQ